MRFSHAFVTTSICSPSRACCLTGRYGSANGVRGLGDTQLNPDERTFAHILSTEGYRTGYVGKWHLNGPETPSEAGFDFEVWFRSNGPHYDRKVMEQGEEKTAEGYIEDYLASRSIEFIEHAVRDDLPFLLHHATQVPHMDSDFRWPAKPETLALYDINKMPVPNNWEDDLEGKPPYLKDSRSRLRGNQYGYRDAKAIQEHFRDYFAAITEMDRSLGRIIDALERLGIRENTLIVLMGDNGWFMGEHGFTSKVLAYEESIRVPLIVCGPNVPHGVSDRLVLNVDIAPSLLEYAGVPVSSRMHGRSLLPILEDGEPQWRDVFFYEALQPELGSWPMMAVRTHRWKLIQTFDVNEPSKLVFEELYDLQTDPDELKNRIETERYGPIVKELRQKLEILKQKFSR